MAKIERVARAIASADSEDYMEDHARYDARAVAAIDAMVTEGGWQDISTAKKDGTIIWAVFHTDIYPRLRPERDDL